MFSKHLNLQDFKQITVFKKLTFFKTIFIIRVGNFKNKEITYKFWRLKIFFLCFNITCSSYGYAYIKKNSKVRSSRKSPTVLKSDGLRQNLMVQVCCEMERKSPMVTEWRRLWRHAMIVNVVTAIWNQQNSSVRLFGRSPDKWWGRL